MHISPLCVKVFLIQMILIILTSLILSTDKLSHFKDACVTSETFKVTFQSISSCITSFSFCVEPLTTKTFFRGCLNLSLILWSLELFCSNQYSMSIYTFFICSYVTSSTLLKNVAVMAFTNQLFTTRYIQRDSR